MPPYFSIKYLVIIFLMAQPQITLRFPYMITKDTAILLKYIENPLKISFLEINVEKVLRL